MNEAGIYAKYLIGEIRADFLDADDKDDIATSDRQSLKEDDPRFRKLKEYVRERILKPIQSQWTQLRKENAEQEARRNPAVDEWFQGLEPDNQRWAKLLFEKIESVPIPDPQYKRELYRHGILAFETLALKQNLGALEQITSPEEFERLKSVFSALDSLEMIRYYQILKARLAVLEKFEQIVDSNAKEKVIQDHLFDHPWLLDPSWERASTDLRKEQSIATAFRGIDAGLTQEELDGRVDIRYQSVAGKHVIIELKRYNRLVDVLVLADQVRKYQSALQKCLQAKYPDDHSEIEVICILGAPPTPQEKDEQNRGVLAQYNARYMTYDQLISATQTSYRDYIEAQEKIKQFEELVDRI
jgi:hypothetical protein